MRKFALSRENKRNGNGVKISGLSEVLKTVDVSEATLNGHIDSRVCGKSATANRSLI